MARVGETSGWVMFSFVVVLGLGCKSPRDHAAGPPAPERADAAADAPPPGLVPVPADGPTAVEPTDGAPADGEAACPAGQTRCAASGEVVEVCTVASGWIRKEDCSAICQDGSCVGSCKPGDRHCGRDQTPETCTAGGEWMPATRCQFVCAGAGNCQGECLPGSRRCAGAGGLQPEICDETGRFVPNGTACANLCSSGSCGGSCPPTQQRCGAGHTPEVCSAQGTWEPRPRCDFVCTGAGVCGGQCRPGAARCAGPGNLTPQRCDDSGAWVAAGAVCQHLCSEGVCGGECTPGTRRCGAAQVVETCNAAGRWVAGSRCERACLGAGTCGGDCVPGATRCSGTTHQTCSNTGSWMASDGVCKKPMGAACSAGVECASNNCAQGRCCNSACNDGCRSCALPGREGTCAPPSAAEVCDDGRDDNCSGAVDEGCGAIQITPNPLDFGTVVANDSKLQEVTLRNTGRQTLRSFDYSVSTDGPGDQGSFGAHGMGNSCDDGEIAPGATCSFLVRVSSRVSSSDGGNGLEVSLTGTAAVTVTTRGSNQRLPMNVPLRAHLVPCMVDGECAAGETCYRRRCAPM